MNKNNFTTTRPLTTVEKIRSYRSSLYQKYLDAHKRLDVSGFYEEMIKGKKCRHKTR